MRVTFIVYRYATGSIDLVQAEVGKTKPTAEEWEEAVKKAKERVGGDVSVVAVLRGLVWYADNAPSDLNNITKGKANESI